MAAKNSQIFEKLNFIRDRMKYLLEIKESWYAYCKEKGVSPLFTSPWHTYIWII